jgi:hypothetical protein
MGSQVASKQFSDNTAASLGSQDYLNQIKNEGVERCFHVNGNGFITTGATQAGNLSVQTENPGTDWAVLDSQAAYKATISNQTGTSISVRQGGAGDAFIIPTGQIFEFEGISNTDQLSIKRTDESNTQVSVVFRWAL